jgi:hypothetical protein
MAQPAVVAQYSGYCGAEGYIRRITCEIIGGIQNLFVVVIARCKKDKEQNNCRKNESLHIVIIYSFQGYFIS